MSVWSVIVPIIWAGGFLGIGYLSPPGNRDSGHPEYFFPAAGAAGLFIFILGLLDLWNKGVFSVLTILLFLIIVLAIFKSHAAIRAYGFVKEDFWISLLATLVLTWFGLASLSFPISTDALYFHLGLPKIYASQGNMSFVPGILFSASPRTSEMITTAFYFLGVERGAPFFIVLVAAVFIFAVWHGAKEFCGYGRLAALLILSVPIFVAQLTGAKNDYLLWGLSYFAALKFIRYISSDKLGDLSWAGIGAGMAAGTKAIGLALFAPMAVIILYFYFLGVKRFSGLLISTTFFVLFALPWYLHSWILTGNPVFPFFDNVFHSPYTSELFETFNRELAIPTISGDFWKLFISPFQLIFEPELFEGRLGFSLLLFPVLLLFVRKISYKIKMALGFSVIFYLVWFFGFPYARFLLPVISLLAIAGSFAAGKALEGPFWLRVPVILSLTIAVVLPIPAAIRDTLPRVRSVVAGTPQREFLSSIKGLDPFRPQSGETVSLLPYIDTWEYINRETPPDSRIGIMASYWTRSDGYYLDRNYIYLNPSEQNQYDFSSLRRPGEIDSVLRKLGLTHIVIDTIVTNEFSHSSPWSTITGFETFGNGVSALQEFLEESASLFHDGGRYKVFQL